MCVKWNASQRKSGDLLDAIFGDESNKGSCAREYRAIAVSIRLAKDKIRKRRRCSWTLPAGIEGELITSFGLDSLEDEERCYAFIPMLPGRFKADLSLLVV